MKPDPFVNKLRELCDNQQPGAILSRPALAKKLGCKVCIVKYAEEQAVIKLRNAFNKNPKNRELLRDVLKSSCA